MGDTDYARRIADRCADLEQHTTSANYMHRIRGATTEISFFASKQAAEIERLRGIAKNAAILLEWLSAERSAHARDDREAIEVIRPKIVEARRTLSLSIQDANKRDASIQRAAEWENWHE